MDWSKWNLEKLQIILWHNLLLLYSKVKQSETEQSKWQYIPGNCIKIVPWSYEGCQQAGNSTEYIWVTFHKNKFNLNSGQKKIKEIKVFLINSFKIKEIN